MMKKTAEKKLSLGKVKVAALSKVNGSGEAFMFSLQCVPSVKISCLSQGSPMCSADICLF